MTDFLTGYVVEAGAGLAGDPGLKASRDGALSVRCGGQGLDAEAGSFMFFPRRRPRRFWAAAGPPGCC